MIYNDPINKQGIVQDISFLLGNTVDLNNYSLEDRARNVNLRFHLVWQMIFESYAGAQFVDNNQTDYPMADLDIENGEENVDIPITALSVRFVEIKDPVSGNWSRLKAITQEEWADMGADATFNSNDMPRYYFPWGGGGAPAKGGSLRLVPTPNFSEEGGIRLFFDPTITEFGPDDTSVVPGFASPFHRMLSIGAALDYALSHNMTNEVSYLSNLWNDYESRLRLYYSKRYLDKFPPRVHFGGGDLMDEFG